MSQYELHETLTAFLEAFDVPSESGIAVEEAELDVPLEIRVFEEDGRLRVCGSPPASIYHSGFESLVQRARMIACSIDSDEFSPIRSG